MSRLAKLRLNAAYGERAYARRKFVTSATHPSCEGQGRRTEIPESRMNVVHDMRAPNAYQNQSHTNSISIGILRHQLHYLQIRLEAYYIGVMPTVAASATRDARAIVQYN